MSDMAASADILARIFTPIVDARMKTLMEIALGTQYAIATMFDQLDHHHVLKKETLLAALKATREGLPEGSPLPVSTALLQIEDLTRRMHHPPTPEEIRAQFRILQGTPRESDELPRDRSPSPDHQCSADEAPSDSRPEQ
jgi:hypothetical protein